MVEQEIAQEVLAPIANGPAVSVQVQLSSGQREPCGYPGLATSPTCSFAKVPSIDTNALHSFNLRSILES